MVNDQEKITIPKTKLILQSCKKWFLSRWNIMKLRESQFVLVWTLFFVLALCLEWVFVIPGLPTGLGLVADFIIMGFIYIVILAIIIVLLRYILAFFYLQRIAALLAGSSLLAGQSLMLMLRVNWGWKVASVLTALVLASTLCFGLFAAYLYVIKRKSVTYTVISLAALLSVVLASSELRNIMNNQDRLEIIEQYERVLLSERNDDNRDKSADNSVDHDGSISDIDEGDTTKLAQWKLDAFPINPAEMGSYHVKHYNYMSAEEDKQDKKDDIIYTSPMDGSSVLKDWSWTKQLYWKFTEDQIPMNGQLWKPEGEGPFPIVFIMHGNHLSEEDSSDGYAYLGELLASHGMIVCSIDANFLNYSVWSGIVDDDQLLRSWLMLAHAASFFELDSTELSIDWQNVAFVGHSRGGQAAAMAVDAKQWLEDQAIVSILDKINVRAVIGIAPTDYRVDSKHAYLRNVNYLTLHGTMDADLIESFGDRQFERTTFDNAGHFKATVELYHANHGQFNTVWGKYDEQFPGAIMLNTAELMKGEDQQEAAKLFINSFLLASLKDQHQYEAVFQDFRTVGQYLPLTGYVTRHQNSNTSYWLDFERSFGNDNWTTSEMLELQVIELKGRNNGRKQNRGLRLQWLGENQQISFEITKQQQYLMTKQIEAITLSVAQAEYALPSNETAADQASNDTSNNDSNSSEAATEQIDELTSIKVEEALNYLTDEGLLEQSADDQLQLLEQFIDQSMQEQGNDLPIEITLSSSNWGEVSLDLSTYYHLLAPVENDFTRFGPLEEEIKKGKYDVSLEPLLQTYIIPIELLGEAVGNLDMTSLETITLTFKSTAGSLIIDNLGVITEGGTYVSYSK